MVGNMLSLKNYFLCLVGFILLILFSVISNNSAAREVEIKEGDNITIELFTSRKLHGSFVRMDSISITYIPSGKTLFFNPKENTVKIEKIRKIYDEKGWVVYNTPKELRNYDYPTREAFVGYSLMTINKHSFTYGNSNETLKGISIAGSGTIKKWLNVETRLNAYQKLEGYIQLFLNYTGYYKKHRYFFGGGAGVLGYWIFSVTPVYSYGGGAKVYIFRDLALRFGLYDYIVPVNKRSKHNFVMEIGITVADWEK